MRPAARPMTGNPLARSGRPWSHRTSQPFFFNVPVARSSHGWPDLAASHVFFFFLEGGQSRFFFFFKGSRRQIQPQPARLGRHRPNPTGRGQISTPAAFPTFLLLLLFFFPFSLKMVDGQIWPRTADLRGQWRRRGGFYLFIYQNVVHKRLPLAQYVIYIYKHFLKYP